MSISCFAMFETGFFDVQLKYRNFNMTNSVWGNVVAKRMSDVEIKKVRSQNGEYERKLLLLELIKTTVILRILVGRRIYGHGRVS